jgi:cleavage and polyadenylation specificity factor subunit 1
MWLAIQISTIHGYILFSAGTKLNVFAHKSGQLVGSGFYDANLYVTGLKVIKDFVMFSDVHKSVHFLRWRQQDRTLTLLAKDFMPLTVTSCDFAVFGRQLTLLVADAMKGLQVCCSSFSNL